MNYSSNDEALYWAEKLAESEDEAFETTLQRIAPQKIIDMVENENASLRIQVARLNDENRRLREALLRQSMDRYEYE